MIPKKILFISHTDIHSDPRILKSILVAESMGYKVNAIGVLTNEKYAPSRKDSSANVMTITLFSKNFTFLPVVLRHACSLIELTFKMLRYSFSSKPDIIHCNDTTVLPLSVLLKIFTSNTKLIYDAHELESDRNGISKLMGWLTLSVERISWPFIDSLIVVSPSIETWYLKNIGQKKSTVILNSPILSTNSNINSNYLRTRFNIPNDSKIFLYIGIIGQGRGIQLLLDTFAQINKKAFIVFLGYGDLVSSVLKYSKKYANIYYHAAVPHESVVQVARSADYGMCLVENVSLSDYYCLPNKMFEYTFAGIPIMASNFPDIRNAVDTYGLGFCVDLNIKSIRSAVEKIVIDDTKFTFKVKDLKALSWDAQAEKLSKMYSEIFI